MDFCRLRECGDDQTEFLFSCLEGWWDWQQEANTYIIYEVISRATKEQRAGKDMDNDAKVWGVFHVNSVRERLLDKVPEGREGVGPAPI